MSTSIKIPLSGKLAYENQLIKQHRREVKKFLVEQRLYDHSGIATIMKYYDLKIDKDNILKVHTHPTVQFLDALCTGQLESLYKFTSVKQ